MKLFNTKSNRIELFVPMKENEVSLYLCGPTVYNYAHIGNARPIVVFDLLRRVLEAQNYKVKFVSNFTDVDDKIINKAIEENVSEREIADRYIDAYEVVRQGLHAYGISAKPRVTEVMDQIVDFIDDLIKSEFAYEVNGNVYFRVGRIPTYGSISHQKIDELIVGARIEENEEKENPLDFALWKNTDNGIKWQTPWGEGRPGWHTECVVMIYDEFKGKIDIHGGGQDLKFPHHENESAQAHACHNHDLANYWVHNAMLNIDGEKMSKSIGNVEWAKDYIEKLGSNVTRWLLLSTHYRLILNITDDAISQAQNELNRIEQVYKKAWLHLNLNERDINLNELSEFYASFMEALNDDLNVANATAVLFEVVKDLNQKLRIKDIDTDAVVVSFSTLEKMLQVLGIEFVRNMFSAEDRDAYRMWEAAKVARDFEEADRIRESLIQKGIL